MSIHILRPSRELLSTINIRPAAWQLTKHSELQQRLKNGCDPAEIARSHLQVMSVSNINLAMNQLRAQRELVITISRRSEAGALVSCLGSTDVDVVIQLGSKLLEFETAKWGRPSHSLVSGRVISDAVYALTKLLADVPDRDRRRRIA